MNYKNIKSYEDACKDQGIDPNNRPDVSMIQEDLQAFVVATHEMAVIAKSLNRNEDGSFWEPDYEDNDEEKWEPIFDMSSGSSGFSLLCSVFRNSFSRVGARLVYRSEAISDFAANKHVDTYRRIHCK